MGKGFDVWCCALNSRLSSISNDIPIYHAQSCTSHHIPLPTTLNRNHTTPSIGVAIGAGTQIAIESASMVLIRSNLFDLLVALDLAKVVFQRVRQNFLWAFVYNVVAIPWAAGKGVVAYE
ncbi:hypothetical protein EON63_04305 [archaeon]|nr:MAG: hypothetical protein EON63_04305 [archaeon]